jgi:hypothetical protein
MEKNLGVVVNTCHQSDTEKLWEDHGPDPISKSSEKKRVEAWLKSQIAYLVRMKL